MLFSLEFGKIFRRKFNYLFAIIISLISFSLVYRLDTLATYFNISQLNVIFTFILKITLGLVIFLMGINYIYSYRDDYETKVNVLLEVGKAKSIRDFSAVFASLIYFLIYYMVLFVVIVGVLFIRARSVFFEFIEVFRNLKMTAEYAIMLILMLLFANLIFLLVLTLFNNTNLAISLSLLYFIGGEVIAEMLENRVSFLAERVDNSVLTIFSKTFNNWNQFLEFDILSFLPLGLNILGLVIFIFIVRTIKKIII